MQADRTRTRAKDRSVGRLSERLDSLYPSDPDRNPNEGPTHFKGRQIISIAEWEHISGLVESYAKDKEITSRAASRPESKTILGYPEDIWKELDSIKWEIKRQALDYFPDGIIHGILSGRYTCPEAQESKLWISDYKELLESMGFDLEQDAKERYQEIKKIWDFHKSSWYRRGVNGYDGNGCNQYTGCVPECKFYAAEGKLYYDEGYD